RFRLIGNDAHRYGPGRYRSRFCVAFYSQLPRATYHEREPMKNLATAILMTLVTTVLLGLIYPLVVTGLAQVIFPENANGQLIRRSDGTVIGSRIIGQPFGGPGYFHSRPSAAGT